MNIAVLISGRGSNLQAILNAEKRKEIGPGSIKVVITNNPKARGLEYAKSYNKKSVIIREDKNLSTESYDQKIIKVLEAYNTDLVVLAGFMRILSPMFVQKYKHKIINIHPSLLPSFPGLNAQKQAYNYGVKITGCTVHFVDEKVDHGPIILQDFVYIKNDDTIEKLEKRILTKEHKIFPKAIKLIAKNRIKIEDRIVRIVN